MKALKKDNGFTLVEVVLVFGLVGILLVLLSMNYLSTHKTYIKATQKADNLEEARIVINFITDNFQKYEAGYCEVLIGESETKLEDGMEGPVKKIIFKEKADSINKITVAYDEGNRKVMFQSNEIANHIEAFTVKRSGQLYDFFIEVKQEGNRAMPEQRITVGTTVNMQYMKDLP